MTSKKAIGFDHSDADTWAKSEIKRRQAEASAVDPGERKEPLTDEAYVKESGSCPYCRSVEIEGGRITIEGGGAWQEISCTACGKSWADSYMLTGYVGEKDDDHEHRGTTGAVIEVTAVASEVTTCPPGAEVTII